LPIDLGNCAETLAWCNRALLLSLAAQALDRSVALAPFSRASAEPRDGDDRKHEDQQTPGDNEQP